MLYQWCNVLFNSGDKALIRNLYRIKKYFFRRTPAEFLKINCNGERLGMLLKEIWKTYSTIQGHKTNRLKHTHTEENVITVDEMVGLLNHKDQKHTYHLIRHIFRDTDLTVQLRTDHSLHFCPEVYFVYLHACCLDSFSCIYILQGSVVTQLICGRIFNNNFIANCPQNVPVKEFEWKLVNIWQRYRQSQSGTFLGGHSVDIIRGIFRSVKVELRCTFYSYFLKV